MTTEMFQQSKLQSEAALNWVVEAEKQRILDTHTAELMKREYQAQIDLLEHQADTEEWRQKYIKRQRSLDTWNCVIGNTCKVVQTGANVATAISGGNTGSSGSPLQTNTTKDILFNPVTQTYGF